MQLYDYNIKDYLPSAPGMGMLVEVKDPEDEIVLSRVSLERKELNLQITLQFGGVGWST